MKTRCSIWMVVACVSIAFLNMNAQSNPDSNELTAEWQGPFGGVPPFDKVRHDWFEPAFDSAIKEYLMEITRIATRETEPNFLNTIEAMEVSGKALDRLSTLFFVMAGNMNSPEYQALSLKIYPLLSSVRDQVYFDRALFSRIEAVYKQRNTVGLTPEQLRLTEQTYEDFARRGARLNESEKKRMGEINTRLAQLFAEFGNRVQADEDTWVTLDGNQLDGLPASLVSVFRSAAEKRGLTGYAVVNTRSAVDPFLTFSDHRDLRESVWRSFVSRGDHGNQNDTNAIISEIVKLRAERAKLLGFASHAHWRMSDTMAKDPARAEALLMQVWKPAAQRVKEEVADMQAMADKEGKGIQIKPWDYRYYMEKVRKDRYALDQSEFKNYFELNNMIQASYHMAKRLYGYDFKEITQPIPVFHPDVRVYHVTNESDGSHVGLFYRDDFARQYKRSGAWQATYRGQHKLGGQVDAIVSNNNNFNKGGEGEPVLISLDDAETLFHEFGHALHALSNDTTYPSLSSTPRDFVEFPSQVHENWVLTRDILDQYARHYHTGETMPQSLIEKMKAAATFNQGFATVEYLACAILDLKIHTDPSGSLDPKGFEASALKEIGMPEEIAMRHRLPHFLHLFSSDSYSAGYYSYLWSDVMAADAWQAFEEAGDPWDPATAKKFKDIILATGDAFERSEAFRKFRGRDPQVEALLKNRGFPVE